MGDMNWEVVLALLLAVGIAVYLSRHLGWAIQQIKDEFDRFE